MCGFCLHLYDIFLKLRLDVSQKNSPEKFKVFADVVMQGYGRRGISAEGLIQEQIAKAKKNGREIDYDTAYEEMIADSMEGILADGKALAKLKVLQERDTSLWEAVKNWAKDVAGKIRAIVDAYKGERMDSREGRIVANMKEILPQLEELYAEGLADSRGNWETDSDAGTKKAAQDGGVQVRYSLKDYSQHQKENWENSKRIVLYKNVEQYKSFIQNALHGKPQTNKKMYFGSIPSDMADDIKKATGINVDGYNLSISENEIRKINKSHGSDKTEQPRGQRAVTESDYLNIPNVVQSPDRITLSPDKYEGKPAIEFRKMNGNETTTVVAVVSDKRLDLFVQTSYVNKKLGA